MLYLAKLKIDLAYNQTDQKNIKMIWKDIYVGKVLYSNLQWWLLQGAGSFVWQRAIFMKSLFTTPCILNSGEILSSE